MPGPGEEITVMQVNHLNKLMNEYNRIYYIDLPVPVMKSLFAGVRCVSENGVPLIIIPDTARAVQSVVRISTIGGKERLLCCACP